MQNGDLMHRELYPWSLLGRTLGFVAGIIAYWLLAGIVFFASGLYLLMTASVDWLLAASGRYQQRTAGGYWSAAANGRFVPVTVI